MRRAAAIMCSGEETSARMEFCLRYETEMATFWANNRGLNYVLFCHQKAHKEIPGNERETEESHLLQHLHKHQRAGQRSCLKANRLAQ